MDRISNTNTIMEYGRSDDSTNISSISISGGNNDKPVANFPLSWNDVVRKNLQTESGMSVTVVEKDLFSNVNGKYGDSQIATVR